MNTLKLITTLATAVLISACSQITTTTEYDKNTDFSRLKTYKWGEGTLSVDKTGNAVDRAMEHLATMVRDEIQPLVNKKLAAKGFEHIEEGNPDFVLQYAAKGQAYDVYSRETYAPGAVSPGTTVQRGGAMMIGKLTLYVLEPGTFKLLWRGESETIIKGDDKSSMRFEKTIEKILNDFPPK